MKVLAVDEDAARAGVAHLGKGYFLRAGEGGHAPMIPRI